MTNRLVYLILANEQVSYFKLKKWTEILKSINLRWLPTVSSKVKKCTFQPQKLPIDISEKNETKVMH